MVNDELPLVSCGIYGTVQGQRLLSSFPLLLNQCVEKFPLVLFSSGFSTAFQPFMVVLHIL